MLVLKFGVGLRVGGGVRNCAVWSLGCAAGLELCGCASCGAGGCWFCAASCGGALGAGGAGVLAPGRPGRWLSSNFFKSFRLICGALLVAIRSLSESTFASGRRVNFCASGG